MEKTVQWAKPLTIISDTILAKLLTVWKNIALNTERTVKRSITKFGIINKKALALIPRKFVRLVYELLVNNQLYYGVSLGASIKESK